MRVYRIVLACDGSKLSTLLDLIEGEEGIRLVNVSDFADPAPLPPSPPPPIPPAPRSPPVSTSRFAGGVKNKGISGDALVLETLRSGPASLADLKRVFTNSKYAPSSTGTYVARLLKDGKIVRRGTGIYALINGATR
jgi:hypothetical protein